MPSSGGATWAGIVAAIEWATYGPDGQPNTGDEADIISMSLGGGEIYNSPIWLAIKKATEEGVVVVVSAGNEGDDQLASMSVGDPGNSPWCISVGATDPYYSDLDEFYGQYTSFGPTISLAVKPDVVAPSGTTVICYTGGYTSEAWHGTSFSCPHTSGAVALILDYIKQHGFSKDRYPWVAKSLLMVTASPLRAQTLLERITYEDMIVGAGAVNLTAAFEELEASVSGGYPQWLYILPTKLPVGISNSTRKVPQHLPYFPYFDRLFINQTIFFNFTIVASHNTTISIVFEGNITDAMYIHSSSSLYVSMPTTYWEFNFTIRPDAIEGYYEGYIIFNDTIYGIIKRVPMKFIVCRPVLRVLFDLKHTDWSIDYRYGQYRFWVRAFEVLHNVSVDMLPHSYAREITVDLLDDYDLVIFPDTASAVPIFLENGTYLGYYYLNFTPSEIQAIREYVERGGVILIYALDEEYHNITNINEIISATEARLTGATWSGKDSVMAVKSVGTHMLVRKVPELPYLGLKLSTTGMSEIFLRHSDAWGKHNLAVCYQNFTGGAIIALGTNFMFDNWAFTGQYSGTGTRAVNVYNFTHNIVEFVRYGKDIIQNASISLGSMVRGSNITVEAYNGTNVINMTWCVVYEYGEEKGLMIYDEVEGNWKADITLEQAGNAYVLIYGYVEEDDGVYYVRRSYKIYVSSSEYNSPRISSPDQGRFFEVLNENVSITIYMTDDTGLIPKTISITANVSPYTKTVIVVNETMIIVNLSIPYSTIHRYVTICGDTFGVGVSISIKDVNLNRGMGTISFSIHAIDTKPPRIYPLTPQQMFVSIDESPKVYINVTDEHKLVNVSITLNISSEWYIIEKNFAMGNSTCLTNITIKKEIFDELGFLFSIYITVESMDEALNEDSAQYIVRLIRIIEQNPPSIELKYISNNTLVALFEEDLNITIQVTDDTAIKDVYVTVANLSSNQYTYSIETISNTTWYIHITVPWNTLANWQGRTVPIVVLVNATDIILNTARKRYVIWTFTKAENNPPIFTPIGFNNGTAVTIPVDGEVSIRINISDDTGIMSANVSMEIPEDKYSINIDKEVKYWLVVITFRWEDFKEYAEGKTVKIMISAMDGNLNIGFTKYVVTVRAEKKPMPLMYIILPVIVAAVMAVVVLVIRKKKSS